MKTIVLPEDVRYMIGELENHGFEGYAVGGCVRDSILGRCPNDWDITTSASPAAVKAIFKRTIDTGIAHGTVTVMLGKNGYEVTTYRIDGVYEDSRHPKEVSFTGDLLEDLKRRDFTINAMAYNEKTGLVDAFGGLSDLETGVIRCVGSPQERFSEDALRIARAVRFAAQLGFRLDEGTYDGARQLAPTLANISAERIQTELVKLLTSPHPDWLRLAWKAGITAVVLPEFDRMMDQPQNNSHHCYSVGEHTLEALRYAAAGEDYAGLDARSLRILRLAILLHDVGKPACLTRDENGTDHFYGHAAAGEKLARAILKRLKFDNDTLEAVCRLVRFHDRFPEPTDKSVRRLITQVGETLFPLLLLLQQADQMAKNPAGRNMRLDALAETRRRFSEIRERGDCLSLKELAVSGRDLIAVGMKPGKEIGETLTKLLEMVLEDPGKNQKEYLMERVAKENRGE